MHMQTSQAAGGAARKPFSSTVVLTAKEAAKLLKVSVSWLAKARMRGDGPPFIRLGRRAVRYTEASVLQWMSRQQRTSTSE